MSEGTLRKATERIYYLPGEERTDRPYLYYIRGDRCGVAVDAGNSKRHVERFYQALAEEGLPPPAYTAITHWHWDHTFGLPYIQGASIGTRLTRDKLLHVSQWPWTPEAMQAREATGEDIAFCNECIRLEYPDLSEIKVKPVDVAIDEPMLLDAGGVTLRLLPHDSTHSRDALFVYVPEEKALFIGDADGEDHYENHGAIDQARLAPMAAFIESLDFERYFMGHDEPDTREGALRYLRGLRQ